MSERLETGARDAEAPPALDGLRAGRAEAARRISFVVGAHPRANEAEPMSRLAPPRIAVRRRWRGWRV